MVRQAKRSYPKNVEKAEHYKKLFIEALEKNNGYVRAAARDLNMCTATFYEYRAKDPEFRKQWADLEYRTFEIVKSKMLEKIEAGDTQAIMYFMNNKGYIEGYGNKLKINLDVIPELDTIQDCKAFQKEIFKKVAKGELRSDEADFLFDKVEKVAKLLQQEIDYNSNKLAKEIEEGFNRLNEINKNIEKQHENI